jgi:hypothetical protein
MNRGLDGVQFDDDGYAVWPSDPDARQQLARDLFGDLVVGKLEEITDEMLAHVDGRWPTPGSMSYEADMVVANLFRTMTAEQRQAVQSLVVKTARLTAYSLFLGFEHFGSGRIDITVQPMDRHGASDEKLSVQKGEWQVDLLEWEETFRERSWQ